MKRFLLRAILSWACVVATNVAARAAPEDDQWAVAAGHYKQQRWALAAEEFARLRQDFPQSRRGDDSLFFEGEALAQLDKHVDAAARFRDYRGRAPQGKFAKHALFRGGEALYLAGKLAEAKDDLTAFQRDFEFDPWQAHGLLYLGEIALAENRAADASALFRQALERYPDAPVREEYRWGLARAYEQLNQGDAALAVYRQLVDQQPPAKSLPQALIAAARWHDQLQQDNEAVAAYARLDKEFPQFAERDSVLYQWAWVERDRHNTEDSDRLFRRVHEEFPASRWWADATYRLAERRLQAKDFAAVDALIAKLLAAKPAGHLPEHALYLHAQAAIAQSQWETAAQRFDLLVRDYPNTALRAPADFWRAEARYRQGRHDEAGDLFSRLAQQSTDGQAPLRAIIALRRGQVFAQQKRWDEARAIAASFARDFPQSPQLHEADYLLGRCLASQGDFDAAREAYRRVTSSPTAGKSETAAMAQWMIGETYLHQKDHATAIKEYLRVEILYPFPTWQAGGLLQAGKCHESLAQFREAAELYERLVANYPATSFHDEAVKRLAVVRQRLAIATAADGG